jgi:5-methylcytosine-specific restriction endonuclease McrA
VVPVETTKRCSRCGETKPLTAFFRDPQRSAHPQAQERVRAHCKVCHNATRRPVKATRWHSIAVGIRRRGGRPSLPLLREGLGEPRICYLCGASLSWDMAVVDHVVPVSRGGGHDLANLRWAHRRCNYAKGDQLLDDFLAMVAAIYAHHVPWPTTGAPPARRRRYSAGPPA